MLSMQTYLLIVIYLGSYFYLITLYDSISSQRPQKNVMLVLLHHLCAVQRDLRQSYDIVSQHPHE